MDEDEEVTPFPSRRLRPIDLLIVTVAVIQEMVEDLGKGIDKIVELLACHANYDNDKTRFADNVRAELESIPTTED
jgi:hypothetical protein